MCFINIIDKDKKIECSVKDNLMKILLENDVFLENPCNGNGTCGKCKVKVVSGEVSKITDTEKNILSDKEIENGIRLSCLTEILGDCNIESINSKKLHHNILSGGYIRDFEFDKYEKGYGIVVDIGTTTVAMGLIKLSTGEEVSYKTMINPQRKYGSDVLTRITYEYENKENGIELMQKAIVEGMNNLINSFCLELNINKSDIYEIVISANCTMAHMLLGEDAKPIGKFPYEPIFKEAQRLKAKNIGLDLDEKTDLYCIAQVSSFIGGDIVSGAYACELKERKGNVLFIDIGTNGEIILSKNGEMSCCSCAAGPALEGMNISCGMTAAKGAIEDLEITKEGIELKVIGDEQPSGLCGSGILASIEQLISHKIINKRGAFIKKDSISEDDYRYNLIKLNGDKREFVICDNPEIIVTQSDVRQVQLAKGAILSGCEALVKESNINMEDLDEVLIAGQFGSHISVKSLVGVGILPKEVENKVKYIGNSSKSGAYIALMSNKAKDEMEKLGKEMNYVELAMVEGYEKIFRDSMEFPIQK